MKWLLVIVICFISYPVIAQKKSSKPPIQIEEAHISDTIKPRDKKAYVIISSNKDSSKTGTWEDRWTDHIEKQSLVIAQKQLLRDSTKITYKVMIDFFINADESIGDLKITCTPANTFIEQECIKMVMNAPRKAPIYRNGKYLRTHIQQPIDIKVK